MHAHLILFKRFLAFSYGTFILLLLQPQLVFAQSNASLSGITNGITAVLRPVVPLLLSVAAAFIVVGVLRLILSSADAEKRKSAIHLVIYGIVGLFIALSAWGLAALLTNTFNLPAEGPAVSVPGAPSADVPPTAERIINQVLDGAVVPLLNLLIVVATIMFIWGVIEFIKDADKDTERKKGREHMIWGIVGLAIMVSSRGIIVLLRNFVATLQ